MRGGNTLISLWILCSSQNRTRASQVVLVVKNPPANAGDIRDSGWIPGSGRTPGGGHGNQLQYSNPLQYSCLENPTDGGAWWATVRRVGNNQTWLKQVSTHACKLGHLEEVLKNHFYQKHLSSPTSPEPKPKPGCGSWEPESYTSIFQPRLLLSGKLSKFCSRPQKWGRGGRKKGREKGWRRGRRSDFAYSGRGSRRNLDLFTHSASGLQTWKLRPQGMSSLRVSFWACKTGRLVGWSPGEIWEGGGGASEVKRWLRTEAAWVKLMFRSWHRR